MADSFKESLESELYSHIRYRMKLTEAASSAASLVEDLSGEIVSRREKGEALERGDFVELERQSMLVNLYNMEAAKVDSRLELLMRFCAPLGVLPKDGTPEAGVLDEASSSPLSFAVEGGRVVPRDKDGYDALMRYCDSRVEGATLEARYAELKKQYEFFKQISGDGGKGKAKEG